MATKQEVRVRVTSCDGFNKSRTFKTLEGAQKFAHSYVSATPELCSWYAVGPSGTTRVTWHGATGSELFPKLFPKTEATVDNDNDEQPGMAMYDQAYYDGCDARDGACDF